MNEHSPSDAYNQDAQNFIAGGVNSNVRRGGASELRCFSHGLGSRLVDVEGREYIDYALGNGPAIFGHAPPFLVEAVAASLRLGQVFAGQHPLELELAKRLRKMVPSVELSRIACTGSEVVQAAIRVSRAFTGRREIVKFEGHYHGWFDNILVNHAGPANDPDGPTPFPQHLPSEGQSAMAAAETRVLPWNNTSALSKYLTAHGQRVAAVMMEPVMCNTGVIRPRSGYLQAARELCTRFGIVLILDEVITGFRLGPGGAQSQFDVRPDLSVFAKALGGGFPVAALGGRQDIMQLIGSAQVNHSGTYNANSVSLAAAIAVIDQLTAADGAAYRHIESIGESLMEGIRGIAKRRGINLKVSGYPSVFHTFFTDEPKTVDYYSYRRSDASRQRRFMESLPARGVRPVPRGTWFVSAAHSGADVEKTLQVVDEALGDL